MKKSTTVLLMGLLSTGTPKANSKTKVDESSDRDAEIIKNLEFFETMDYLEDDEFEKVVPEDLREDGVEL